MNKTLSNTTENQTQEQVKDVQFWGLPNMWKLISKAWSEEEGWMKSTKAMQLPTGVLIQVSTQQGDNIAEALQFIPHLEISAFDKNDNEVKGNSKEKVVVRNFFLEND